MTAPQASVAASSARWTAVVTRDARADGRFIYAVTTTGVYCRPSCSSRKPMRSHAIFFTTPADARAGGFRACKRCRPDGPFDDPWVSAIARACTLVARADRVPSLAALAARFGVSPAHFQRTFKRIVGVSPREYAEAHRLGRVKGRLRRGQSVTAAMLDAGYQSSSRFYDNAAKKMGMAPSTYRRGGIGEIIRYATVRCDLGWLLVAATPRGLCAVSIGDSVKPLRAALKAEYPLARLERANPALTAWMRAIAALAAGRPAAADLPFDVQATAFQWQVWSALRRIPAGETRTYGELAEAIGRPRAARAVARACASNRLALVIPCHRVVPASGGTGGYRWGPTRKQALLAQEGKMPRRDQIRPIALV